MLALFDGLPQFIVNDPQLLDIFNDPAEDAEVAKVSYVRVKRVAYFSETLSDYEEVSEEGPYDFALSKE